MGGTHYDTRQNHPGVSREVKFNLQPGRGEGANSMKSSKTSADNLGGAGKSFGVGDRGAEGEGGMGVELGKQ